MFILLSPESVFMSQNHGVTMTRKRGYTVELENGELVEEELRPRNSGIPVEEYGEVYHCACGKEFQEKQKVIRHLEKLKTHEAKPSADEDKPDDTAPEWRNLNKGDDN